MKKPFEVIAIIGKPRDQQAIQTHKDLYVWLTSLGYTVFIDDRLKEINRYMLTLLVFLI